MRDWLRTLLGFFILSSCLCQLLPDGRNRKYVRLFCGMIFLLLVFQPLSGLTGFSDILSESWNRAFQTEADDGVLEKIREAGEGKKEAVLSAYESWLKEQAVSLCEERGFSLVEWELFLSEEETPIGAKLVVAKEQEGEIKIDPVKIGYQEETYQKTAETEAFKTQFCARTSLSEGQVTVWLEI